MLSDYWYVSLLDSNPRQITQKSSKRYTESKIETRRKREHTVPWYPSNFPLLALKADRSGSLVPMIESYCCFATWTSDSKSALVNDDMLNDESRNKNSLIQSDPISKSVATQVPFELHVVAMIAMSVGVPVTIAPLGSPNQMLVLSAALGPAHYENIILEFITSTILKREDKSSETYHRVH